MICNCIAWNGDSSYTAYIYTVCFLHLTAAFSVSLELQGGDCSDQLTLICRHSDVFTPPQWIHNGTLETGEALGTVFPGAVYTVQTRTEHTTTITGIDSVQALDGHLIQCVYDVLGNLTKSNAVKYSFFPPGQSYGHCVIDTFQYIYSGNIILWACLLYLVGVSVARNVLNAFAPAL